MDNKSLKCSESNVDDWSWCRDALWILYSSRWSTKTLKSLKTAPQHRASWFGLCMKKKNDNKNNNNNNLYSLHSVHGGSEPTDCGSTRTFLCLLVILVPCIFWQVQGWFYFRTSPHVQALVTKVSFLLSANTRTFSYSDDIRLRKNIAKKTKQESVTIAKLIVNWASLPTYATNRNTISIERQLAKFRDWKEYVTHAKSQVFKPKPKYKKIPKTCMYSTKIISNNKPQKNWHWHLGILAILAQS